MYKGYFPVSQLKTGLKKALHSYVHNEGWQARIEQIKRLVLKELDATKANDLSRLIPGLGRVYPIHYESDMMAVYRIGTPREFKYSELS